MDHSTKSSKKPTKNKNNTNKNLRNHSALKFKIEKYNSTENDENKNMEKYKIVRVTDIDVKDLVGGLIHDFCIYSSICVIGHGLRGNLFIK